MLAIWALPFLAVASQASVHRTTVLLAEDLLSGQSIDGDVNQRWTLQPKPRWGPDGRGMFIIIGTGCGTCGFATLWGAWAYLPHHPANDMKAQIGPIQANTEATFLKASAHTFASMEDELHLAAAGDWTCDDWRIAVVQAHDKKEGEEALKTALGCREWFVKNEMDNGFMFNPATGKGK